MVYFFEKFEFQKMTFFGTPVKLIFMFFEGNKKLELSKSFKVTIKCRVYSGVT